MSELAGGATPRDCPYVGLDYYREELGAWFFGRDAERDKIITNLQAARLTLLHAESGVGKSSLLRAGVAWRLRRQLAREQPAWDAAVDIPVVFSSWQDDPISGLVGTIRAAIEPLMAGRPGPELPTDRLGPAIEAATDAADAGLLIILDQFEEHFLYRSREPVPERFADELASCINRVDLPANFLIAIREDAYAGLGDMFKGRIANVYGNYLHIDNLDRVSAEKAIRESLEVYNGQPGVTQRVGIQDELVDAVLDQVRAHRADSSPAWGGAAAAGADGHVAAPLLQLVMETIWQRERAEGSHDLRLSTLQSLHGVTKIVDTHLSKALHALPGRDRETAIDMFDRLVTPSGGKIAESVFDLARRTGYPEQRAASVLDKLDQARIVRPVPAPPGQDPMRFRRYEIFHDVLTPAINRTITVRQERRRAWRFRRWTALAVSLLIVILAVGIWRYRSAIIQKETAEADQLAVHASANLARDPALSAREALLALRLHNTREAMAALRNALPELQAVRTFRDEALVFSAVFDPIDPNRVASADAKGIARIWDVKTGRPLVRLSPSKAFKQTGPATAVAFSPAGDEVAVGYSDGTVILFDARSGTELEQPINVQSSVAGVRFVGITGELAIATQHGADLWLPHQGSKCCEMLAPTGPANSIVVNPANPREFAVATGQGTVIWTLGHDLRPLWHRWLDAKSYDYSAEFNPDGREVVTASAGGMVSVYDLATFKRAMTFDAGQTNATSAAFSPDQAHVVASYASGTVLVWDTSTGLELSRLAGNAASVATAQFSADGSEVVTAGYDDTIRVWNAQPRELLATFPSSFSGGTPSLPNTVYLARYSANGSRILTVDSSGKAYVFTSGGDPVYSHGRPAIIDPGAKANVVSAQFNPTGTEIVTAESDGTAKLWHATGDDYAQIDLTTPIRLNGAAVNAGFSPDGSRIVIAANDGTAQIRSVQTGQLLHRLNPGHLLPLPAAVFSPNGRQVLTADGDGQVEVWNAATGHEIQVLGQPGPGISDIEFNSSGKKFVAVSSNGVVTVRAARNDWPVLALIKTCPRPTTVSFDGGGSKIVVACGKDGAQVYDATTGQLLTVIQPREGAILSATFSPDGKSILTAIGAKNVGAVQIWSSELATASLPMLERNAARSPVNPSPASTASLISTALTGTWTGSYVCPMGRIGLTLVIRATQGGALAATFNFYATPRNLGIPPGSFTMTGTYSTAGLDLNRNQWISQPPGSIMTDLRAGPPSKGDTILGGKVITPQMRGCTTFAVMKSASSWSG